MPKTIVFIKNQEDPSSYYRLYQYLSGKGCRFVECVSLKTYRWNYDSEAPSVYKRMVMAAENLMKVTFFCLWDKLIWKSEKVIINRKLFPRKMPFYGTALLKWYVKGKRIYWDFDDNIIADGEITGKEIKLLEKNSEKIIVTNVYLKKTISSVFQNKVVLMPTTDINLKQYEEKLIEKERLYLYEREIRLIWVGTRNNLIYLEEIMPVLDECAVLLKAAGKKLCLLVVSNKGTVIKPKEIRIKNIQWTREEALRQLRTAHVGLMPLHDNEYTRGKGGFKAVQYLGMGMPAVVSDVGYNAEVVDNGVNGFRCQNIGEWKNNIMELCRTSDRWLEFSRKARRKWEESFNPDKQATFWTDVVQGNRRMPEEEEL